MVVESVVENVSPVPFDIEWTVQGSEWNLDDDMPESVGNEMGDVAASSNARYQRDLDKVSHRHCQAVDVSSIPKKRKHSSTDPLTNFKSVSNKECELATQTVSVENDDDGPLGCSAPDTAVSENCCLRQHISKHLHSLQNTRNLKHVCEKCPATFNSIRQFEIHMKTHCHDKQPFKCSQCERKFFRIWQRTRHESLHSHLNKFICEQCGRKFTSARYHEKHMNSHNRTHVCDICNGMYSSNSRLEKHRSKCHPNDIPSSNLEVPKVVSLQQDLQDSSEEEDDRSVGLYGQHELSLDYSSNNVVPQNVQLLESFKSKTSKMDMVASKAE
jgi:hypothetical protein